MDKWVASVAARMLTGLLAGIALSAAASAQEPRISATAVQQIQTLMQEKASRTPAQRRVSSDLLFEARRQRGEAVVQGLTSVRSSVRSDASGRVQVDIKAEVTDSLLQQVEALGGRVVYAHAGYGTIRASVPLMQLEVLATSPQVRFIRKASLPVASKANTSEGDVTHMADLARADLASAGLDVDGSGTKVCVLSDSVDSLATVQGSGDLPPSIDILTGQDGNALPGTIGEGTATLEVVHDLAPGADLGFATAWLGEASFAQNILDLRAAGCDVLVDNVIHISEPVFQDGIVAQAVETVVADGAVYFSAAGNFGNYNDGTSSVWEGDYLATTVPTVTTCPVELGPNCLDSYESAHDFGVGTALNRVDVDSPIGFTLQWSDPQGASTNDYDLFLIDGSTVVDYSTNFQTGTQDPYEGIDSRGVENDHTGLHLLIVRETGAADRYLHLNTFGGQLASATAGQTWGHSAAAGAFSVAAVNWGSGTPAPFTGAESVETYSSDGPRRVFYDAAGAEITPGDVSSTGGTVRQKPDLAAADNVSTATPGFEVFFGTSASAAHAAAIASLMLSREPSLSAADLRDIFAETALDIEAAGVDQDSGLGIVDALSALRKLRDAGVSDFNADAMSDILWRHIDGRVAIWQMDGPLKEDSAVVAQLATTWVIEDLGDFNEDARADILWRSNVDDSVVIWQMDGFTKLGSASIGNVASSWAVEGIGDFDDNGHADILWHNSESGVAVIWLMDGYTKLATTSIGTLDLSWQVVGVGDFTGDERSDILWRNTVTGQSVIWQMNGATKEATATIGSPVIDWRVEGVGDFNSDGSADILWRNYDTNAVVVWEMDGVTKESSATIGSVDHTVWEVSRLGDYNGSGHDDILWRNPTTGNTVMWQMNGFTREVSQSIAVISTDWSIR